MTQRLTLVHRAKIEDQNTRQRLARAKHVELHPESRVIDLIDCPCGRKFRPKREIDCTRAAIVLKGRSRYCSQTCFERYQGR